MKLKIKPLRVVLLCLLVALIGAILIVSTCIFIFLQTPWDWRQPTLIAIWFISSLVFLILSLTNNYFTLEKNFICHHKFKKEMYYYFKDIAYIDETYSEKHKVILFVTNKGDIRYMPFDSKGKLYQAMLERCKNLISYEELIVKFPNTRKINPPK